MIFAFFLEKYRPSASLEIENPKRRTEYPPASRIGPCLFKLDQPYSPQQHKKDIRIVKFVGSLDNRDFLVPLISHRARFMRKQHDVLRIHRRPAEGGTVLLDLLIKALPPRHQHKMHQGEDGGDVHP